MEVTVNASIMEVVVNTNNDVERKNKDFKYQYLHKFNDNLLNAVIVLLEE